MPGEDNKKPSIENLRSGATFFKESLFVIIILMLFFFPAVIREVLEDAGIKSIAGIEFRDDIEQSQKESKLALEEITVLRDSLDILNKRLVAAINQTSDMQTKKELEVIKITLSESKEKTFQIVNKLQNNIQRQDSILRVLPKRQTK